MFILSLSLYGSQSTKQKNQHLISLKFRFISFLIAVFSMVLLINNQNKNSTIKYNHRSNANKENPNHEFSQPKLTIFRWGYMEIINQIYVLKLKITWKCKTTCMLLDHLYFFFFFYFSELLHYGFYIACKGNSSKS